MRRAVAPTREIFARSPFARRLQTWPRGYPGDFETVEYILDRRNWAAPGTMAYGIEQVALDSPIAEQHRNKVRLQSEAILSTAITHRSRPGGARVLVLASGGAADVRMIEGDLVRLGAKIVLLDQDAAALDFAHARVPALGPQLVTVCANVVRGLAALHPLGPFDLVVAGGLFDYLSDGLIVRVLGHSRAHLLTPHGRMIFTNVSRDNPYRLWMECLADWRLIHRTAGDLTRLCLESGFSAEDILVGADPTNLALVAQCDRHAEAPAASRP